MDFGSGPYQIRGLEIFFIQKGFLQIEEHTSRKTQHHQNVDSKLTYIFNIMPIKMLLGTSLVD